MATWLASLRYTTRSPGRIWEKRHPASGVALPLGGARKGDAGPPVGPLREAGAVEGVRAVRAPHVGGADRGADGGDGCRCPAGGSGGAGHGGGPSAAAGAALPLGLLPGSEVVEEPPGGAESSLDGGLAVPQPFALLLQPAQGAGDLGLLLAQLALGVQQAMQLVMLPKADAVQCGGLRQVVLGFAGKQQRDRRVHAAGAVLGAGQRAQGVAQLS